MSTRDPIDVNGGGVHVGEAREETQRARKAISWSGRGILIDGLALTYILHTRTV